jgi:hypothetical protein
MLTKEVVIAGDVVTLTSSDGRSLSFDPWEVSADARGKWNW